MPSCCHHAVAASGLFSRLACIYRYRYRIFGLEHTQKQLVAGLRGIGFEGANLLEIGCGVGQLHQWLLAQGASRAVGIDLSPSMLEQAKLLATERGLAGRISYLLGDFTDLAETIEPADITLLDKVICCYPDARSLLKKALSKTRKAIALTYPRDTRPTRLGVAIMNRILAMSGSQFRIFVHDPTLVEKWIVAEGFSKCYQRRTFTWLTQIYHRHS